MARMLVVLFVLSSSCLLLSTSVVQANQYISSNNNNIRKLLHYEPAPSEPACFELRGKEIQIAGLNAYASGCPDTARKALVFASDIFGYDIPKLRMIADKAAEAGFYAVVPDFFNGTAYVSVNANYNDWRKSHDAAVIAKLGPPVVRALKDNLGMASVGAAGFCFGAKIATELAKAADEVDGLVLLHPTDVDPVEDIGRVVRPVKIIAALDDQYCTPAIVKNFTEVLDSKVPRVDHDVSSLDHGPQHGWTTRYSCGDQLAVDAANEAHRFMLDWFLAYVTGDV